MLKKLMAIAVGWAKRYRLMDVTPAEEKLSELRLNICSECPKAKVSTALRIIDGEARNVSGLYCSECKCPCVQKTLVTGEKCPLKKW